KKIFFFPILNNFWGGPAIKNPPQKKKKQPPPPPPGLQPNTLCKSTQDSPRLVAAKRTTNTLCLCRPITIQTTLWDYHPAAFSVLTLLL
ncbi:MAG: hypothetical protein OXI96_11070, partial [Acidimicrobiaceae bacterium]|nr:hypothetical protein [Acidimicrobiaceae bacterium]